MGDARAAGPGAGNHDDGRISGHLAVEGGRFIHVDDRLQVEAFGHQPAQRAAVAVLHPAVRADEAEPATGGEQRQRAFDERHVQVGAIVERRVTAAVFGQQHRRNQLLPHVGRIADDEVERGRQRAQQEVALPQPLPDQGLRRVRPDAGRGQFLAECGAGTTAAVVMQLNGLQRRTKHGQDVGVAGATSRSPGREQAAHGHPQEFAATGGRFQQTAGMQRPVRRIPDQIQNELDDLDAREHRTAGFGIVLGRESGHGGGDGGRTDRLGRERVGIGKQGQRGQETIPRQRRDHRAGTSYWGCSGCACAAWKPVLPAAWATIRCARPSPPPVPAQ